MPFDPSKLQKAHEELGSENGVPPGKLAGQPTVGEQLDAIKTQEMERRLANQQPENQLGPVGGLQAGVQGLKTGFLRQDLPEDASLPTKIGSAVGRYGPLAAGAIAAPELLPGLAGAGAMGSALVQGMGAGGGEALGLTGSKAFGGNAPDTMGGILKAGGETGLAAAATDLGLSGVIGLLNKAPQMANTFLKIPKEAIKRAITRMQDGVDIIPSSGPLAQTKLEYKAAGILKDLQDAVLQQRKVKGQAVDDALTQLHDKTQGKALFDVGPLARDLRTFMKDTLQTADPTVKKLVGSDYGQILGVLKTMEKSPMKTAKSMVQIRRELDKLKDFNSQGVPKIQSDAGTQAYDRLANNFREVIDGSSKILKDDSLLKANADFHEFANKYDEIRDMIGTKNQFGKTLRDKMVRLQGQFNSGGMGTDLIDKIGEDVPAVRKKVTQLMDHLAGRAFVMGELGTPSGQAKDLLRTMLTPENIGSTIRFGQSAPVKMAGKVIKPAIRVGVPSLLQPDQGPPQMSTK